MNLKRSQEQQQQQQFSNFKDRLGLLRLRGLKVKALTDKDMRKILVPVLFLRSAVPIVKRVMRFPTVPKMMQIK